jgi:hypothetical protein
MRNSVLNANYSFFGVPVHDKKAFLNPKTQKSIQTGHVCWLVGLPRTKKTAKVPELVLKYSPTPAVEETSAEDQEIVDSIREEN